MKWIISLSGDEVDLYEISKSLNTDNLTVYKEGDKYYLKSSQILSTDEYKEVSNKVKELIDLINGATKLALGTRNTIAVSDIYILKDDGGRVLFGSVDFSASLRVRASYQITRADGTIEICNPADSVPKWLELSKQNEIINKIFKLISHDSDSWVI